MRIITAVFMLSRTTPAQSFETPTPPALWPAPSPYLMAQFSPQGPEVLRQLTGRRIKSFQLVAAEICNHSPSPSTFSTGLLYESAGRAGFSWLQPQTAAAVMSRTASLNIRNIIVEVATIGSSVALVVTTSGLVAASGKVLGAIAVGHALTDQAGPALKSHAPDPSSTIALLIPPSTTMELGPHSCYQGLLGANYNAKIKNVPVTVEVVP